MQILLFSGWDAFGCAALKRLIENITCELFKTVRFNRQCRDEINILFSALQFLLVVCFLLPLHRVPTHWYAFELTSQSAPEKCVQCAHTNRTATNGSRNRWPTSGVWIYLYLHSAHTNPHTYSQYNARTRHTALNNFGERWCVCSHHGRGTTMSQLHKI